jgi:hypothetical protein
VRALSLYEAVLAVHVSAVVIAFGVTFAYPVIFAVGARRDPRSLPVLHRIAYTVDRVLVNPGLLLVVLAGIYLASEGKHWSQFFVQWGLGVAILIGALVGSVMIPTGKRAAQVAERDLAAIESGALPEMTPEYRKLVRRLQIVGTTLSGLVLVTIFLMVAHA